MTALMLPLEQHNHTTPCPACGGRGVTGERYKMGVTGHVLLLEVFCPSCGGCGNGDPEHAGCKPEWHPCPDDDGLYECPDDNWNGPDDDPYAGDVCPSCGTGRGWYPVQGFTGEGDDAKMHVLRGLCGCSESRLVPAEAEAT